MYVDLIPAPHCCALNKAGQDHPLRFSRCGVEYFRPFQRFQDFHALGGQCFFLGLIGRQDALIFFLRLLRRSLALCFGMSWSMIIKSSRDSPVRVLTTSSSKAATALEAFSIAASASLSALACVPPSRRIHRLRGKIGKHVRSLCLHGHER